MAGLVVFCTLIVAATYFTVETKSRDSILTETAKSFIQLGVIGIFGAFVKFAFDQVSELQKKQQANLEVKRELLGRIRKFKQTVKTVPYHIEEERTVEAYLREMRVLLNSYIEIDDFGNDTRLLEFIHPYNERIGIHVLIMSLFVGKLLDEAAKQRLETWSQILELPVYSHYRKSALDFLGTEDKSTPYRVDYDIHYNMIKEELRLLISGKTSSKWHQTKGTVSSFHLNEDNKPSGTLYQIKFKYFYYIKGKKFDSDNTFRSFDKKIIEHGFNYFLKVKEEITVYYDPINPAVSVVRLS
ncbi:MAG TPA: hypothetical protein V6C84_09600 [Coleofasciculaceae cyanobacterium]